MYSLPGARFTTEWLEEYKNISIQGYNIIACLLAYPLYAALSIMSWIADASVISVTTLSQLISGNAAAAAVDKSDRVAVKIKPPMPLVVIIPGWLRTKKKKREREW